MQLLELTARVVWHCWNWRFFSQSVEATCSTAGDYSRENKAPFFNRNWWSVWIPLSPESMGMLACCHAPTGDRDNISSSKVKSNDTCSLIAIQPFWSKYEKPYKPSFYSFTGNFFLSLRATITYRCDVPLRASVTFSSGQHFPLGVSNLWHASSENWQISASRISWRDTWRPLC